MADQDLELGSGLVEGAPRALGIHPDPTAPTSAHKASGRVVEGRGVKAKVAAQTAQTGIKPDVWKVLEQMVSVDAIEKAMKEGRDFTKIIYAEPLLS